MTTKYIAIQIETHPDRFIENAFGPFDTPEEAHTYADKQFMIWILW